MTTIKRRKR